MKPQITPFWKSNVYFEKFHSLAMNLMKTTYNFDTGFNSIELNYLHLKTYFLSDFYQNTRSTVKK